MQADPSAEWIDAPRTDDQSWGLSGRSTLFQTGRLRGSARTTGRDAVPAPEGDTAVGDRHLEGFVANSTVTGMVISAAENRSPATNSASFSLASKSP
jgi:hypothetical protein